MIFHGIEKFSLVDYDGYTACTLFTGNCNYRCPFCRNAPLVLCPDGQPTIPNEEIEAYLRRRVGILDGVCISGGEPTLCHDLPEFAAFVKSLGYKIKLDTNGTSPSTIKELISNGLVDYVAMDIKNSPDMYPLTTGVSNPHTDRVFESAKILFEAWKEGLIGYEFRTTLVEGHHTEDDFIILADLLRDAPKYFLQKFEDRGNCIASSGMAPIPKETAEKFANILKESIVYVGLRGYDS